MSSKEMKKHKRHNPHLACRDAFEEGMIAFKGNVTVHDAIPVALAVLKRTKCITADQDTQYAKLKPKGYPIELLQP